MVRQGRQPRRRTLQKENLMRVSLATIAMTAFLAATVTAHAQAPREDAAKPPQPAAEELEGDICLRASPPARCLSASPNRASPSQETRGAAPPGTISGNEPEGDSCLRASPPARCPTDR